ncbi:uncharacterized protein LOC121986709 [Zingiber officinale]|uniref:uncharacterized protein LOC121986709 n=1 Tax=Zingiber officinale TaxID=94328 RepID=UPI001C4C6D6C|nr:uncharacterized protein LOC121986709 [Zingiber officinale]
MPLFGFTGNEVQSVSQMKLAISLGEEPLKRTRATNFIVVDTPSAYNVILGRPALSEFRAVVSTLYQKIKFPVEDQVGEVRGDQLAARCCYVEMIEERRCYIPVAHEQSVPEVDRAKPRDIEETFGTLRTYGVKLNPQKCLFGAKSGRFLGYIVTERGIETADWSLPFFKILRRATKFQWDTECHKAFKELKVYLNSLPVLAKPVAREALRVYLSSTEYVVGSALVRSDGEEQPVYFLSHILKDVESRYTGLEKLVFTLVLAARRLRPYFLAHPIVVITNIPLGRALLNPEASGRLIKWITELSEFDIRYHPRTAIKAQSLADFVTEVPYPEPKATWRVYVDGSSTRQGSGIGVMLISPHGKRMHLSILLDYRATNNEAEYEVLIAGLQATRHVGANKVLIHSDSQLTAQQLSGAFEISNVRLKLYAGAFKKLKASFREVLIQKIPRAENQAADELAKLASSISPIVIQQSIEQVSLVAHIDRMEGLTFPNDWQTTIAEFLRSGATPSDREEAHLLRKRAGHFVLIGDQLYKKSFSRPLLKCVGSEDVDYILQ